MYVFTDHKISGTAFILSVACILTEQFSYKVAFKLFEYANIILYPILLCNMGIKIVFCAIFLCSPFCSFCF